MRMFLLFLFVLGGLGLDGTVRVPLLVVDSGKAPRLVLTVTHQGCVPGLCYPRRQRQLEPTLIATRGDEATATQ